MSIPNMVADVKENDIPLFNPKDVKTWSKEFTISMMKKKRNHLGLRPHGLVMPPGNAPRERQTDYEKKVEVWSERNDTCVASIFEATKNFPEAFEIVDQYIEEKEALPVNDPNKEVLSEDLIKRLIARFEGQLEDELGKLSSQFTNFSFEPNKPVTPGIDRLNGICLKLGQHNRAPTVEAKVAKVVEALQKTEGLEKLWLGIVMLPNYTFDTVSQACKRYDGAMEKINEARATTDEIHYNDGDNQVVCSYPKCGKTGHTQAQCYLKKRDQQAAKWKRAGKKISKQDNKGRQTPGLKSFKGCYCCGDMNHRADRCPQAENARNDEDSDSDDGSPPNNKKKQGHKRDFSKNPQVYVNDRKQNKKLRGEGHMVTDVDDEPDECLLSLSEENEVVFLDSCASKRIFIVRDANVMERVEYTPSSIQTTRSDAKLDCVGEGTFQHWTDVRICPTSVKNIVSAGLLRAKGYGLDLFLNPSIARLSDKQEVLPAKYAANGMPYVKLWDLLMLPNLMVEDAPVGGEVYLSDKIDVDPMEILHQRCGHFSKVKLLEAYRNRLFTGSGLQRRHLGKKA